MDFATFLIIVIVANAIVTTFLVVKVRELQGVVAAMGMMLIKGKVTSVLDNIMRHMEGECECEEHAEDEAVEDKPKKHAKKEEKQA